MLVQSLSMGILCQGLAFLCSSDPVLSLYGNDLLDISEGHYLSSRKSGCSAIGQPETQPQTAARR